MEFSGNNITTYLVGLIPIGAYLLKIFIDNWRATDLEKIMMSNLKRFQLGLTKYLLIGIAFGVFIYFYLIIFPVEETDDMESFTLILFIIAVFIIIASVIFLLEKTLVFVVNIFSFKFDYYILDDENEPVFRVIKNSGNNHLLVESNEIEEFIENPKTKRYKRIRRENDKLSSFYQSKKIYVALFVMLVMNVAVFISLLKTTLWMQFVLYLLFISLVVLFLLLLINYYIEKKVRPK